MRYTTRKPGPLRLSVEQNTPGANITTFGEALWWAVATITTIGDSNFYLVTELGRFVAAETAAAEAPHEELTRLTARIKELTACIHQLSAPSLGHAGAEHVPTHRR
ncbi:potassium channel family protein [Arthrobacter sp. 4R501]|uniref:potassium channel family protein n=1 Tax=Arthrobacter sp. 4R501 TaxID=2058886 RepID=UPI000CE52B6F|nr:potassium channel family protein [Arthrobacter sp. 4R501]